MIDSGVGLLPVTVTTIVDPPKKPSWLPSFILGGDVFHQNPTDMMPFKPAFFCFATKIPKDQSYPWWRVLVELSKGIFFEKAILRINPILKPS